RRRLGNELLLPQRRKGIRQLWPAVRPGQKHKPLDYRHDLPVRYADVADRRWAVKLKSLCAALVMMAVLLAMASAKTRDTKDEAAKSAAASLPAQHDQEMRFHSNCSRCHAAPPKFPARMMGTIVRHMRVRAMLTDDDVRYILRYMTQ